MSPPRAPPPPPFAAPPGMRWDPDKRRFFKVDDGGARLQAVPHTAKRVHETRFPWALAHRPTDSAAQGTAGDEAVRPGQEGEEEEHEDEAQAEAPYRRTSHFGSARGRGKAVRNKGGGSGGSSSHSSSEDPHHDHDDVEECAASSPSQPVARRALAIPRPWQHLVPSAPVSTQPSSYTPPSYAQSMAQYRLASLPAAHRSKAVRDAAVCLKCCSYRLHVDHVGSLDEPPAVDTLLSAANHPNFLGVAEQRRDGSACLTYAIDVRQRYAANDLLFDPEPPTRNALRVDSVRLGVVPILLRKSDRDRLARIQGGGPGTPLRPRPLVPMHTWEPHRRIHMRGGGLTRCDGDVLANLSYSSLHLSVLGDARAAAVAVGSLPVTHAEGRCQDDDVPAFCEVSSVEARVRLDPDQAAATATSTDSQGGSRSRMHAQASREGVTAFALRHHVAHDEGGHVVSVALARGRYLQVASARHRDTLEQALEDVASRFDAGMDQHAFEGGMVCLPSDCVCLEFNRSASRLLAGLRNGALVSLAVDAVRGATGGRKLSQVRHSWHDHGVARTVTYLARVGDSEQMVVGWLDGSLRLVDAVDPDRVLRVFLGHRLEERPGLPVCIEPRHRLLAAAGEDRGVRVWSLDSPIPLSQPWDEATEGEDQAKMAEAQTDVARSAALGGAPRTLRGRFARLPTAMCFVSRGSESALVGAGGGAASTHRGDAGGIGPTASGWSPVMLAVATYRSTIVFYG